MAIFHGPHAYISPSWYQEPNLVPTWNYTAVHASGPLHVVSDGDRRAEIVSQMVQRNESPRACPWRIEDQDAESIERLLAAIVAFELPIERLEGKWKLGQNHPPARRERVVEQLRRSDREDDLAVAALMAETLSVPS